MSRFRLFIISLLLSVVLSPAASALVVLQYHHVSAKTPFSTSTSPELFRWQMNWLAKNQFKVVSWQQVRRSLQSGDSLPDKSVLITFDDGYISVLENAIPILDQHQFPYLIFINPGLIAEHDSAMIGWQSLKKLVAKGATIGNHSLNHPYMLNRGQAETESAWQLRISQQIETADKQIAKRLGHTEKVFAWPYGEFSPSLIRLLKRLGYYGFAQHSGIVSQYANPQALPRFAMGAGYGNHKDFSIKMNALPMPVTQVKVWADNTEQGDSSLLPEYLKQLRLSLSLDRAHTIGQLNCFYHNQPVQVKLQDNQHWQITLDNLVQARRQRINCTAPSATPGRFYWYSWPMFMSWTNE